MQAAGSFGPRISNSARWASKRRLPIALVLAVLVVLALVLMGVFRPAATGLPSNSGTQPSSAPTKPAVNLVKQNIVVRTDQGPVKGASIRLVPATGDPITATSGADGTATVELAPGKYLVTATKDGLDTVFQVNVDIPSKDGVLDLKAASKGTAQVPTDNQSARVILSGVKTTEDAILVALAHGQAGGGINSRDEIASTNENATIPASGVTFFRDGNLVATRSGTDAGKPAIEIVTKDGRHVFVQKECGNVIIPSKGGPTPTPTTGPTPGPTPTGTLTPTPGPTPAPTPAPTPTPRTPASYSPQINAFKTDGSLTWVNIQYNWVGTNVNNGVSPVGPYRCSWTVNGANGGNNCDGGSMNGLTPGTFNICLSVTDSDGDPGSNCKAFTFASSQTVSPTPTPTPAPTPQVTPSTTPRPSPPPGY